MTQRFLCGAAIVGASAAAVPAHPGVGIVMDSRGAVFYTDLTQVWRIAPDGAKSVAVRSVHTHELCLDAADNLFGEHVWYEGEATDRWGHRVWRLSRDGKLTDVIPAREGFLHDYSFVRDRAGNMYWAERGARTVIRRRKPEGGIGDVSRGPFRDVRWMTASADGSVYLIDSGDLLRLDSNGSLTKVARGLAERSVTRFQVNEPHRVMGLWLDPEENVYVANYGAGLVKRVSPEGKVSVISRSRFPWSPTGGLVASNGDLWLLEYSLSNAVRVRRLGRGGKERIY